MADFVHLMYMCGKRASCTFSVLSHFFFHENSQDVCGSKSWLGKMQTKLWFGE